MTPQIYFFSKLDIERFWKSVKKTDNCWEWIGV